MDSYIVSKEGCFIKDIAFVLFSIENNINLLPENFKKCYEKYFKACYIRNVPNNI